MGLHCYMVGCVSGGHGGVLEIELEGWVGKREQFEIGDWGGVQ